MPRQDLIEIKLRQLRGDVQSLRAGVQVIARRGGSTIQTNSMEVEFQQQRVDLLTWAYNQTDEQIAEHIQKLGTSLGPGWEGLKYGIHRGLDHETVKTISFIEDLEIALGVHPYVKDM